MSIGGQRTPTIERSSLADELLVNYQGNTTRLPMQKLAVQLANTPEISALGDAKQLYPTRADLPAASGQNVSFSAVVFQDPDGDNNGTWTVQLVSGVKTWVWAYGLSQSQIVATDNGDGTANAIKAVTRQAVVDEKIVIMNVFRTNTGTPVTVQFNEQSPLTIKTMSGLNPAPGALQENSSFMAIARGTELQMLTDQAVANLLYAARDIALEKAGQASDSASDASNSKNAASASANLSASSALQAIAAAEASGAGVSYDSYSAANTAVSSIANLQVVRVWSDETKGGAQSFYRKEGGELVLKLVLPFGDITPEMFGAVSGGVVDCTTAIQNALTFATANKLDVWFPSKIYRVSTVTPPAGCVMKSAGVTFKAQGTATDQGVINIFASDVVINGVFFFDLNREATRAINANASCVDFIHVGYMEGWDPKQDQANFNAVFMFNGCIRARVGHLYPRDYKKNDVPTIDTLYGGVRAPNCQGFYFDTIECDNGNQGFNPNGATGVRGGRIITRNLSDNSLYIIGDIRDVNINSVDADDGEEVVVLYSNFDNAKVYIGSITANNCGKSLNPRAGGGYHIGSIFGFDAPIAQSTDTPSVYSGARNVRIDSCNLIMTDPTRRPLQLINNSGWSFGSLRMEHPNPLGGYFARIEGDFDDFSAGVVELIGDVASPVTSGFRIVGGSVSNPQPRMRMGTVIRRGVSNVISVSSSPDLTNVRYYDDQLGFVGARCDSVAVTSAMVRAVATKLSVAQGDTIGGFEVMTSDTSLGAGPTRVFGTRTRATNSAGSVHETDVLDDAGNQVAVVMPANAGMTVKLPTSPINIPDGCMWNNNGVPGIRGADFAVNGSFAADANWTKGANWTISGGVAAKTAGAANALQQAVTLIVGRTYLISWDTVSVSGGTFRAQLEGGSTVQGATEASVGTKHALLTAVSGNNTFSILGSSAAEGSIDNVRIRAV